MKSFNGAIDKNLLPPELKNDQNEIRKIGVEIEFVGLTPEKVCHLLKDLFPGQIHRINDCEYLLTYTEYGDFRVELDARLLKTLAARSEHNIQKDVFFDIEGFLKNAVSNALEDVIPVEIVTPPLPILNFPVLDKIVPTLKEHGARDTHTSTLAAFGVHLNPETPSMKEDVIRHFIQSYALLSDWLRKEIAVDISRVASTFIKEYPVKYRERLLQRDYKPSMAQLIDDYLYYNPTRNRALDMLPLFSAIDEGKVKKWVDSPLIKARPTFHYRLANSNISQPSWQLTTEWERWLMVEKLVADAALRHDMIDAFNQLTTANWFSFRSKKQRWLKMTSEFIKRL